MFNPLSGFCFLIYTLFTEMISDTLCPFKIKQKQIDHIGGNGVVNPQEIIVIKLGEGPDMHTQAEYEYSSKNALNEQRHRN